MKTISRNVFRTVRIMSLAITMAISGMGVATANAFIVPDAGQTKCYDDTQEIIPCPSPGQDFYGQDAQYTINPMSYTKLDAAGKDLPDSATNWVMVRDNVTGLIWEMKTNMDDVKNYADPHDADNDYTWYDPNPATNGGNAGTAGNGTDTKDFIDALNAANFGGYSDWRMPDREELRSIVDYSIPYHGPTINKNYFPNTCTGSYWSSSSVAHDNRDAWLVHFHYGYTSYSSIKFYSDHVRAVRGGQTATLPRFVDNSNGTVTDTKIGLMWQQATGTGVAMTWKAALAYCENLSLAGCMDWRLPNIKELASLADLSRYNPAIDTGYFSDTKSSAYYWSSSTYADRTYYAWYVTFYNGSNESNSKLRSSDYYVRCVRGGQSGALDDLNILTVDGTYTGNITPSRISNFSVNIDKNRAVLLEVIPTSDTDQFIVDGKFGERVSFARSGDITTDKKTPKGSYEIVISPTEAGTYYFSIYGNKVANTGSTFSIKVRYADKLLSDVFPKKAGNSGSVSLTVTGLGFINGVSIRLTQSGKPTLLGEKTILTSGTELTSSFTLNGAAIGSYDVVAVWPDNTTQTLGKAVGIFQGTQGKFEANITMPEAVRVARSYVSWLEYKNTGDADLPAPLIILSANCPISLNKDDISQTTLQILAIGSSSMPGILRIGESVRIPIYFIAPDADYVQFSLSLAKDISTAIDWAAQKSIMKPAGMTDAEWNTIFPALTTALGNTWSQYFEVLRQDAFRIKQRGYEEHDVRKYIRLEADRATGKPIAAISGILKHAVTMMPLENVFLKFRSTSGDVVKSTKTAYYPSGYFVVEGLADGTYEVSAKGYFFDPPQTITISGQNDRNGLVLYAKSSGIIEPDEPIQVKTDIIAPPVQQPPIIPDPIGNYLSQIVRPRDPNEKVAFGGVGDKNYINFGDRIRYIIYFENKADAAVPAQEVFITDELPNNYDFSSLKVESLSFGNVIVSNPKDTAFFNTSVTIPDYRAGVSKQWKVKVFTEFDPKTRRLKATFQTIDPETEDLPQDVNAGLLPPENGSGRGKGYIVFSVETAKDLSLGTVISNKASIVFDTNAPIETNTVFNTARYVADMNNDRDITLADAIIALKVLAGLDQPDVNVGADVNGDGKIGLEEVVYSLQIVAGLR